MGWEFAALWVDDAAWQWSWRRVADDSGATLQASAPFSELEACIEDAKQHGFDEDETPSSEAVGLRRADRRARLSFFDAS